MIIQCINCNKNFDVNSELIPSSGRTIQCGSCNHVWFFDPKKLIVKKKVDFENIKIQEKIPLSQIKPKNNKKSKIEIKKKNINESNNKNYEITQYHGKKNFSLSNFLSYLIVIIISFVALIIVVDTFKNPLYQIFPNLELTMFNLFETLKDIKLFIRDLI
tara:strand:+ start:177 stop:656 length:480 start_codon:yes stop_codon:yes gene_type:complete